MAVVKLFTAYFWDCPCGQRNFSESVPVELSDDDKHYLAVREGIDVEDIGRTGDFVTMPDEVTCSKCQAEHEVIDPRESASDRWWEGDDDV